MKKIYLPIALLLTSVFANAQNTTVTTTSLNNQSSTVFDALNVFNFQSIPATNAVELRWATTTDNNLERLDVERSTNGSEFMLVGAVRAQTNTIGTKYNFTDATPVQGVNYYRLRSVSKTGEFAYSKTIRLDMGKYRTELVVVPNPVQRGIMNLQMNNFTKGRYALNMYNSSGQPVFSRTMNHAGGNSTEAINLPATLKKGIYFLQITNGVSRMNQQVMVD